MVIVEYCKYGNVQNILQIHRDQFIDQINRAGDTIDSTISHRVRTEIEEPIESIAPISNTDIQEGRAPKAVPNYYTSAPRGGSRMETSS